MEGQKMSMDLYNEMWSDLHHKHNIHLNGVGLDCWKDIKKYIDDKDVLIEMIEQITNTLNCKVGEVDYLQSGLKELTDNFEKENERLKEELKTVNDCLDDVHSNMDEIILYQVSLRTGEIEPHPEEMEMIEGSS